MHAGDFSASGFRLSHGAGANHAKRLKPYVHNLWKTAANSTRRTPLGAGEGTRTLTPSRARAPKTRAAAISPLPPVLPIKSKPMAGV
jgi:hypothetical protein